jgi:hypothetical protein
LRYRGGVRLLCAGALGLLALLLVACPGPTYVVEQYAGPRRPRDEVAVLRVNGSDAARPVRVDGEDLGKPLAGLAEDARLHVEMLPGRHTVGVAALVPGALVEELAFEAAAGKVYRVVVGPARVVEVDRGSDAVVRDVSAPPNDDVSPERRTLD